MTTHTVDSELVNVPHSVTLPGRSLRCCPYQVSPLSLLHSPPLRSALLDRRTVYYTRRLCLHQLFLRPRRELSSLQRQLTGAVRHVKCQLRVLCPFEPNLTLFKISVKFPIPGFTHICPVAPHRPVFLSLCETAARSVLFS